MFTLSVVQVASDLDDDQFVAAGDQQADEDVSEYDEDSDYEEEEDEEDEGDEEEDEEEEEEDDDDVQDSATEIETDSEFDQNSNVDVRLGPQDIPTIVVNELESDQLKRSVEQLFTLEEWPQVNGNEASAAAVPSSPRHQVSSSPQPVEADLHEERPRVRGEPDPKYVHQYVSLEHARPLQRTVSDGDGKSSSTSNLTSPASGILAYLRRHELLERSPSTDMVASKNSLELKKKYLLDYPTPSGTLTQKSASVTNLDSKLKSLVDRIDEAQKLLNPAPQPSVPMQVFLQNTANLFQTPRPSSSNPSINLETSKSRPTLMTGFETSRSHQRINEAEAEAEPESLSSDSDQVPPYPPPEPPSLEEEVNVDPVEENDSKPVDNLTVESNMESTDDFGKDQCGTVPVSGSDPGVVEAINVVVADLHSSVTESQSEGKSVNGDTTDVSSDSDDDSDAPPVETYNQFVTVPESTIPEQTGWNSGKVLSVVTEETFEFDAVAVRPKLAVQEDFDLSPVSDSNDLIDEVMPTSAVAIGITRSKSRESIDSSKYGLTDHDFSDWAENSLGGDFDGGVVKPFKSAVLEHSTPEMACAIQKNSSVLDDIEYADRSEDVPPEKLGYSPLIEESTPEKKLNLTVMALHLKFNPLAPIHGFFLMNPYPSTVH